MMKRTTDDTTTMTDQALVAAAGRGDAAAFDELHARHAPLAWRLGLAVTGDPDDAATAVAEATGTTFTALRAGRFQALEHRLALAAATRNAALDLRRSRGAAASPLVGDDADALLANAFAALPERWRSVLWLRDAEGMDANDVAPVVELSTDGVDQLAVRARRGLRDRYLRADAAATADRDCTRAIARLGGLQDGTLNAGDRDTLEQHLEVCLDCADRSVRVGALAGALPALAVPTAIDLHDRARDTWRASLASSTATGLSPRTEKILAGASAFAAAVGIVGATFLGTGDDGDPVASPLAPLVADIDTPKPVDLSTLTLPLTTPDPITRTARRSLSRSWEPTMPTGGGADDGDDGEAAAPATDTSPATEVSDPTPAVEAPAGTGDLPVDVSVGEDTSVTLGPATVDANPDEGGDILDIDGAERLDPVIDAVNDTLEPVAEAAEPVTEPVLDALEPVNQVVEPITDTVNTTVNQTVTTLGGNLGL